MPKTTSLSLDSIRIDPEVSPRAALNKDAIADYQALYEAEKADHPLPPLRVFHADGDDTYLLSRGFHRIAAAVAAGIQSHDCQIVKGDWWAAYLDARKDDLGETSGVRRTAADRRRIIEGLLDQERSKGWTQQQIADASLCPLRTVERIIRERKDSESGKDRPPQCEKPPMAGLPKEVSILPETIQEHGKRAEALAKCATAIQKGLANGTLKLSDDRIDVLASLPADQQTAIARELRFGKPWQAALEKAGAKVPAKKAVKKSGPKKLPKAIKAPPTDSPEHEAFVARQQLKVYADTIGRWLSHKPSIDDYRAQYPGKLGDRVVKAATELYEALKNWQKGIK